MNASRRRGGIVALLLAIMLALVGCTSPQGVPNPIEVTEVPRTWVDKVHAPEPEIGAAWPLTGVEGAVEDRPVMSIKVENSRQARPQTGVQSADIVWEEMIEGGYTRWMAMYHSTLPETVGPIRSLRPMDLPIATPFGGQLIFSGAQRAFLDQAHASSLQILTHDGGAAGFYRTSDRSAPHNVYGTPSEFLAQGRDTVQDADTVELEPVFEFAPKGEDPTAVREGDSASTVQVRFPSTSPDWTWSKDAEAWERSEDGQDAVTEDEGRISATNVLVLRMQVENTAFTDPSGAPVPETQMIGSGEAIIASGGHTITGTWSKEDAESMIVLETDDGGKVELAPGNTWIELLPVSGSSVSVT